ncbi:hypothetical protein SDC9_75224 [bioreactor metagenome]|uniref:Uncharacterized protein n=1 Tax=bioreactor metagenome TaxID=1076179 RepID=A0A644YK70_9ZZZZ
MTKSEAESTAIDRHPHEGRGTRYLASASVFTDDFTTDTAVLNFPQFQAESIIPFIRDISGFFAINKLKGQNALGR